MEIIKFKVVELSKNGCYTSAIIGHLGSKTLGRIYPERTWVSADKAAIKSGYGLLVFDNYKDAQQFASKWPKTAIFTCHVKGPMKLPAIRINTCRGDDLALEDFELENHLQGWPNGTAMYKEVKLVDRIDFLR